MSTSTDHLTSLLAGEQAVMETKVGGYVDYHRARFDYVHEICRRLRPDPGTRVLDVGLSALTMELLQRYASVTSLGFPLEPWSVTETSLPDGSRRALVGHVAYDFNEAQHSTPIPTDARFDLIVFAEVIEHLYTAPELTLFALKEVMAPGGLLIVQTPNAAALHKRAKLLVGLNPYERIRINPQNPGHFREYTKSELISIARGLDLEIVSHAFRDYFGWPDDPFTFVLFKAIVAVAPGLARGQTIVLRKRA